MFVMVCVCRCVYSMCALWCQPCPWPGLRGPAAVPCAGLHSWGEPWGRAAAWCSSPPHPLSSFFFFLSFFLFFTLLLGFLLQGPSLSDSTCNNTVTFLHLLLLHPRRPPPPSTSTSASTASTDAADRKMNTSVTGKLLTVTAVTVRAAVERRLSVLIFKLRRTGD